MKGNKDKVIEEVKSRKLMDEIRLIVDDEVISHDEVIEEGRRIALLIEEELVRLITEEMHTEGD